MDREVYFVKKVSQSKGKEPFTYLQLYCDLGYEKLVITMDKNIIAQLLDVQVSVLYSNSFEVDKPIKVCTLIPNKEL